MTFSPGSSGSYEAVVGVYANLVVNSFSETDQPVASVVMKGVAEEPRVEIQTFSPAGDETGSKSLSPPVLDYGVIVGGTASTRQLKLANKGLAQLPLCLSITAKVKKKRYLCVNFVIMVMCCPCP